MKTRLILYLIASACAVCAADDVVFAGFEGGDYGAWTVEGTAFGTAPAPGTLPRQMKVEGFAGRGLVNSFNGGDGAKGRLVSPEFSIERKFIAFLIGGGGWEGTTCMNLLVRGKAVRTATGPNVKPGGSERLEPSGWDVSEFAGQRARIEIVDAASGGWGHINVDQIVFTDVKPRIAPKLIASAAREIVAEKRWLNFPVQGRANRRHVTLAVGGKVERPFDVEFADGEPEWWAPLDISAWRGKTLTITVAQLPEGSHALERITQSDEFPGAAQLYRETLRPQFHFSAKRGWLNDPNGLAFFRGEYHLFFQHSPFSWGGGFKHWGHAVSRDMVHWEEVAEALYPDDLGQMFSGSGVVDRANSSGFGTKEQPPLVLVYTAAGNPTTQCVAFTTNGRDVAKFSGNPVIAQITGGNRDPRVFWHEPTKRWVLALYVEKPPQHTVHFFTSANLRDWTLASVTNGGVGADHFLHECPDIFELPIDGDRSKTKWVLSGANSDYMIGTFDGATFTAETERQTEFRGRGAYAAQTFSDEPKGRCVQIGWFFAATPGMPFSQCMTVPVELTLRSTPEGLRLAAWPVQELESLRHETRMVKPQPLRPGDNPLAHMRGELLDIEAAIDPGTARELVLDVRGTRIAIDAVKREISCGKARAPLPLAGGLVKLRVLADRTTLEIFGADGLVFVPVATTPQPGDRSLALGATGGEAKVVSLAVHHLQSIWPAASK